MKKLNLSTLRKSFKTKGKDDDFTMLQKPALVSDFSMGQAPFIGCYTKDLTCALHGEDARGPKNRSKSESLMGTLKRRLSSKSKTKSKGITSSFGYGDDDDDDDDNTFSSSSVPVTFSEVRARRPLQSVSSHSHYYSPSPWPIRPLNPEEDCFKMEVKMKANSPSLGDIRIEELFEGVVDESPKKKESKGELGVKVGDCVPVVIGLVPQDYIQYTIPLDEGLYPDSTPSSTNTSSPMEQANVSPDANPERIDRLLSSDPMAGWHVGGIVPWSSRSEDALLSLSLSCGELLRNFSEFNAPDSLIGRPLGFDPNFAPGVSGVYDSVQINGPTAVMSLTQELKKLARQGWYWGPITRWEAEDKLTDLADGAFLVRDSSDDRYLLSLSFRSQGKTLHTRIEHSNGHFSFYEQPDVEGHSSIVDLIEHSIRDSESGAFCYSRSRQLGSATYPVRLTGPVSRFMQVRSLQYSCRFVIRQYTRIDLIQKLPLPNRMKDYLQEKHY